MGGAGGSSDRLWPKPRPWHLDLARTKPIKICKYLAILRTTVGHFEFGSQKSLQAVNNWCRQAPITKTILTLFSRIGKCVKIQCPTYRRMKQRRSTNLNPNTTFLDIVFQTWPCACTWAHIRHRPCTCAPQGIEWKTVLRSVSTSEVLFKLKSFVMDLIIQVPFQI